jgi:hypothetical protein
LDGSRITRAAQVVVPAFLAFVVGRAVLWASGRRDRFDFWSADSWVRFDSEHYLTIARVGYRFAPCAPDSAYGAAAWCGNTGWLPGYPALVRVLAHAGLSWEAAGVVVAAISHVLLLVLLSHLLREAPWAQRRVALTLVALAPGQVYHHAVFPISLFTLLAVAAMAAAARGSWTASGVCGALAAGVYSTGFLLAAVLVTPALLQWKDKPRAWGALRAALLTSSGFIAALAVQWWSVGRWDAFFQVQAKYGHGIHSPAAPLAAALTALRESSRDWIAWQTVLVAVLIITMAIAIIARAYRPQGFDQLLVFFAATYWLFPLVVGGRISLYRADAVLLPCMFLARRLPLFVQLALLGILAYLDYRMGIRFFRGVLV